MSDSAQRIAALIREGRKIEAIKLLRESTGLGLREATSEIERLSAGPSAPISDLTGSGETSPLPSGSISNEVADLARQGKKIQAIKLHREQTGMGLKEAKEHVEAATGGGRRGCAASVLFLVVSLAGMVAALAEAVI